MKTELKAPLPKPPPSIVAEAKYRMTERLGILCGSDEPTPAQLKIAEGEYFATVARWRRGDLKE